MWQQSNTVCSLLLTVVAAVEPFKKSPNTLRAVRKLSIHLYYHTDPPQHPAERRKHAALQLVTGQPLAPLKEMLLSKLQFFFVTSMHTDLLLLNQAQIRLEIPSSFFLLSSAVEWFCVTLKNTHFGFVWLPLCFIDICFHFSQPGRSAEWTRSASAHQ